MTITALRQGGLLTITLNRPEAGNRLNTATITALENELTAATGDDGVEVVVLAGAGADFCLGREAAGSPVTPKNLESEFGRIQRVNELVQAAPFVTVAVLHGRAVGAGLSLAGRCDLVVASADARLSFPEVPHGVPPTIVLSHYAFALQRIPLMDLILTGREIDPVEGQRIGLVSRVIPSAELSASVREITDLMLAHDKDVVRTVKSFMRALPGVSPAQAPKLGISIYANAMVQRALGDRGELNG